MALIAMAYHENVIKIHHVAGDQGRIVGMLTAPEERIYQKYKSTPRKQQQAREEQLVATDSALEDSNQEEQEDEGDAGVMETESVQCKQLLEQLQDRMYQEQQQKRIKQGAAEVVSVMGAYPPRPGSGKKQHLVMYPLLDLGNKLIHCYATTVHKVGEHILLRA